MTHFCHKIVFLKQRFEDLPELAVRISSGRVPLIERIGIHFEIVLSLDLNLFGQPGLKKTCYGALPVVTFPYLVRVGTGL